MRKLLRAFVLGASIGGALFCSTVASATCHAVSPAGAGTHSGVDWNNSLAGVPGTLVAGDVYYLADGSYPTYSTNNSGSSGSPITIRKATGADQGQNCSPSIAAGFNVSTMGSAQAAFVTASAAPPFTVGNSFITLDGNGSSTKPGCGAFADNGAGSADCGIKLDMTACFGGGAHDCYGLSTQNSPTNLTMRYVEVKGTGDAANGTDNDQAVRLITVSNFLGFHVYVHDCSAVCSTQVSGTNNTWDHSAFWKNRDSSGGHGQGIQDGPGSSSGLTLSYNIFKDMEGQGALASLNGGTDANYRIYGNIFYRCQNNCNSRGGLTNGMITCINPGTNCSNWQIYQNVFVNNPNGNGIVLNNSSVGTLTERNNLWYSNQGTATMASAGVTEDHNSFLNSTVAGAGSGTGDIVNASAPNPFTSWPADPGVFTLASDGGNWNNRVALGAPFDTDITGTSFSTDRGAFQFVTGGLAPPTNLQAVPIVKPLFFLF